MTGSDLGRSSSFLEEYIAWLDLDSSQRQQKEEFLKGAYLAAWATDDLSERLAVLTFIERAHYAPGYPLIIEALRGEEGNLAGHAAAIVIALASARIFLGLDALDALTEYGAKFPADKEIADQALRAIRQLS